jgi:hypothetical protein
MSQEGDLRLAHVIGRPTGGWAARQRCCDCVGQLVSLVARTALEDPFVFQLRLEGAACRLVNVEPVAAFTAIQLLHFAGPLLRQQT